jgi:hypothetical protein
MSFALKPAACFYFALCSVHNKDSEHNIKDTEN